MADSLRDLISQRETIVIEDEAIKHGFSPIPGYILKDKKLSFGARVAYGVLLSYAWQTGSCFPGQVRMAEDMGTTDRSVRTFLKELRDNNYIDWKQRGLNKTNVYYILSVQQRFKRHVNRGDRKHTSTPDRKDSSGQKRKHTSD